MSLFYDSDAKSLFLYHDGSKLVKRKNILYLIWAYQLDMVVIMKLWFIIIIIQGATFINNNMCFLVLFSQSHILQLVHSIFNILRKNKKRKFSLKLVVVVKKNAKVLLDKNVHYIRFHHLYSLNVLWWISLVWLAQRHIL